MEISTIFAQRLPRAEQTARKIHELLVEEEVDLGTGLMALATAMVNGMTTMHNNARTENTSNEAKTFISLILTMLTIHATDAAAVEGPKKEIH